MPSDLFLQDWLYEQIESGMACKCRLKRRLISICQARFRLHPARPESLVNKNSPEETNADRLGPLPLSTEGHQFSMNLNPDVQSAFTSGLWKNKQIVPTLRRLFAQDLITAVRNNAQIQLIT